MKNLLYIFLAIGIFFTSCEEEDDPFNPTSSFSCKIDGAQLSDTHPLGEIITDKPIYNGGLRIKGVSNLSVKVMNEITIEIGDANNKFRDNFDVGIDYDIATFGKGMVVEGIDTSVTILSSASGNILFSNISANKVSGTFNFEAVNIENPLLPKVVVTEGSFTDIGY